MKFKGKIKTVSKRKNREYERNYHFRLWFSPAKSTRLALTLKELLGLFYLSQPPNGYINPLISTDQEDQTQLVATDLFWATIKFNDIRRRFKIKTGLFLKWKDYKKIISQDWSVEKIMDELKTTAYGATWLKLKSIGLNSGHNTRLDRRQSPL